MRLTGPVDRDVAHRRLEALGHQGEFSLRLDQAMLARAGARVHPRLTAGTVLIPDRHGERSALIARAHRERPDVRLGQKLLAFFLGEGHAARLAPTPVKPV